VHQPLVSSMPIHQQPHVSMLLETLRWTGFSDIFTLQANDHPYDIQSTSPHNHLYGYRYKAPTYDVTIPYDVSMSNTVSLSRVSGSPVYLTSPAASPYPTTPMTYPMANHLTSRARCKSNTSRTCSPSGLRVLKRSMNMYGQGWRETQLT
jgi:hypothetical protein